MRRPWPFVFQQSAIAHLMEEVVYIKEALALHFHFTITPARDTKTLCPSKNNRYFRWLRLGKTTIVRKISEMVSDFCLSATGQLLQIGGIHQQPQYHGVQFRPSDAFDNELLIEHTWARSKMATPSICLSMTLCTTGAPSGPFTSSFKTRYFRRHHDFHQQTSARAHRP